MRTSATSTAGVGAVVAAVVAVAAAAAAVAAASTAAAVAVAASTGDETAAALYSCSLCSGVGSMSGQAGRLRWLPAGTGEQ